MYSIIKINSKCKSKAINMSISSNSAGGEHTIRGRAYKQDVEPANHGTRLGLTASHWSAPLGHSPDWFIKKSDFLPNLVGVKDGEVTTLQYCRGDGPPQPAPLALPHVRTPCTDAYVHTTSDALQPLIPRVCNAEPRMTARKVK